MAGFARQLGINPQQALAVLFWMLPQRVDQLTPDGQVPQGDIGAALGGLGGAGGAGILGVLAGMLGGLLGKRRDEPPPDTAPNRAPLPVNLGVRWPRRAQDQWARDRHR